MAFHTGRSREGLFAVMACPAGIASVHIVHGQFRAPFFHQEESGMAFDTVESPGMALMGEVHRHS